MSLVLETLDEFTSGDFVVIHKHLCVFQGLHLILYLLHYLRFSFLQDDSRLSNEDYRELFLLFDRNRDMEETVVRIGSQFASFLEDVTYSAYWMADG